MLGPLGDRPLGRYPLGEQLCDVRLAGLIIGSRSAWDFTNPETYTLPRSLLVDMFAWGAGGTGGAALGGATGGGGGAAGYARMILNAGENIIWSLGADTRGTTADGSTHWGANGVDTVVTVRGRVMTAQGGRGGRTDNVGSGRAVATGFDVNRYGGGSGERGEFGAGSYGGGLYNGGGAGGFTDMFPGLMQAKGMPGMGEGSQGALYPVPPGVGGGAKLSTTDGNDGTWAGGGFFLAVMYQV